MNEKTNDQQKNSTFFIAVIFGTHRVIEKVLIKCRFTKHDWG